MSDMGIGEREGASGPSSSAPPGGGTRVSIPSLDALALAVAAHPASRYVLLILCGMVIFSYISFRVSLIWQLVSSVSLVVFSTFLAKYRPDLRLYLVLLSTAVSLRYLFWRVNNTLEFITVPDAALGLILFLSEVYGVMILLLGYFQTLYELRRLPVPLPPDPDSLPSVDIFIPTYNEDTTIVGRTATGAMMIDYPKKTVYILDDGRRPAMEELAKSIGCEYMIRGDNKHAKAGNINAALKRTHGELVSIFDADHVPVRSFLQMTVGFFLQDPRMALVQTPHHFFNPDPFQRNLLAEGRVPAEQELFYHVILPGDDFWNSAFFCGSCAVLRRTALEGVGGIAQETVTEDAHTAMKIHSRGWKSAYLPIPQAAGLATERYAFHVKQRMRWAQGMVQIFRLDNPLLKRGLTLPQRINYFNAMMHFLFGIPRLVYVLAPLTYLLFGARPIHADPFEVFSYAIPHILMAGLTNSLVFRGFRHSFWAEVYEMSIAWHTAKVTILTMISPRDHKFNVTAKGEGTLDRAEFDWRNARPNVVLFAVSLLGLLAAPIRLYYAPLEKNTILLNSGWTVFNMMILLSAIMVAVEQRQLRRSYRLDRTLPGVILLESGVWLPIQTQDISETGCRFECPGLTQTVNVRRLKVFGKNGAGITLGADQVFQDIQQTGSTMGVQFHTMTDAQNQALIQVLFSAADSWINFESEQDKFSKGFFELWKTPFRVLWTLVRQAREVRKHLQVEG